MGPYAEHVDNHDDDTDRDSRVGDVERPEMVRAPVHVDKIHDRSDDDTVQQVASCAADDQRETESRDDLVLCEAGRVYADSHERSKRDEGDQRAFERKIGGVEKA
jgi:hypothetical protein